jgi:TolA-binding protein
MKSELATWTPICSTGLTVIRLLIVLSLALAVLGCSFDNTMYNARKYFKSAQSKPLSQNGKPTPQAIDEYTKAIKKCGYILTERKNSPEADDALFIMAQSLYYKGNSQFQAKDQFESLIRNFPNSPYSPLATMFIARIYREINEARQADNILEAYIRKPETAKWHPMALALLAEFAIQDRDFIKAQYWLEKILTQYPKSIEYKEAAFLLGKNYFEQYDYANSLIQFQKVVNTRGINNIVILDAKYYIALNLLLTNEYQQSYSAINKLMKKDIRPEKIPQLKLLKGRIMLALNKFEEANELLQSIIKTNTRTPASAEAYYWLAEYYYYQKRDVKNAVENYNKAKTETTGSDLTAIASNKYTALTQIYQGSKINHTENPQLYVDNKMTTAENYYNILSQPDSAFTVIDSLKLVPLSFQPQLDTLSLRIAFLQASMDSLIIMPEITVSKNTPLNDTLSVVKTDSVSVDSLALVEKNLPAQQDSLSTTPKQFSVAVNDSLAMTQDKLVTVSQDSLSMAFYQDILTAKDSLGTEQNKLAVDSVSVMPQLPPKPIIKDEPKYRQFEQQITSLEQQRKQLTDTQNLYKNEYLPFSVFVKASLVSKGLADTTLLRNIYEEMTAQYPGNKYTNALKMLLDGKPVRLIDTALEMEETELDKALVDIVSAPDSAIAVLNKLTQSSYTNISSKANFRLGWFYVFDRPDTIKAKPFFNQVVKLDRNSDFTLMTLRFYNGNRFTFKTADADTLVNSSVLADTLQSRAVLDTLYKNAAKDTLERTQENLLKNLLEPTTDNNDKLLINPPDDNTPPIGKPDEPVIIKPD